MADFRVMLTMRPVSRWHSEKSSTYISLNGGCSTHQSTLDRPLEGPGQVRRARTGPTEDDRVLVGRQFLLVGEHVRVRVDADRQQLRQRTGCGSLGNEVRGPGPELRGDSVVVLPLEQRPDVRRPSGTVPIVRVGGEIEQVAVPELDVLGAVHDLLAAQLPAVEVVDPHAVGNRGVLEVPPVDLHRRVLVGVFGEPRRGLIPRHRRVSDVAADGVGRRRHQEYGQDRSGERRSTLA